MNRQFPKTWQPGDYENSLYENWEKSGYFKPEINKDGEPFTIIMPPPNSNGSLHLGHAVFITLEDIMTRFARLQGKAALWLPGADHAGFETQVVYEKKLEKEGKSRFGMDRKELYDGMWQFTQENKAKMEDQLRELGASCDWSREKFTLDEDIIKTVYQTFKKLYDDGLVYRDYRPVNWCTKHQTSLSDLEVKYEEQTDPLYYIKYGPIEVATTRPETIYADVAVAVNPSDSRYKHLVGKKVPLPLTSRTIEVITDELVDIKFGTGAVKVTPAHSPVDFEIAKKHSLPTDIQILTKEGRFFPDGRIGLDLEPSEGEQLVHSKVIEARRLTVQFLEKNNLISKIDNNYNHSVGKCYKCGTVIEPLILPQWFIAMDKNGKSGKNLALDALKAVKGGEVKFVSKQFEKVFNHWLTNIRDWNVSRQIVWGIQLPVWYCENSKNTSEAGFDSREVGCPPIITDGKEPKECPHCGSKVTRDSDVFDTWFSSGQWPFATLKATKNTSGVGLDSREVDDTVNGKQITDDERFYPTSVMETGWDILFFWVARMIMLGLYETGKAPFKHVYLHGLVRDKDRQKMSKSKGNVIDPLGVAEQYGSDAVRLALVFGVSAGSDVVISEEKIRGMRNFTNKIWNASRFVAFSVSEGDFMTGELGDEKLANLDIDESILTEADKKMLNAHAEVIKAVTKAIENFQFQIAAETIYDYFWHTFCDQYIESAKSQLSGLSHPEQREGSSDLDSSALPQNDKLKANTKKILIKVLSEGLVLLHPFIPFVTEAVWQELRELYPNLKESIVIASWPK